MPNRRDNLFKSERLLEYHIGMISDILYFNDICNLRVLVYYESNPAVKTADTKHSVFLGHGLIVIR